MRKVGGLEKFVCVWIIISCFVWFDALKFWTGFVGEVFQRRFGLSSAQGHLLASSRVV